MNARYHTDHVRGFSESTGSQVTSYCGSRVTLIMSGSWSTGPFLLSTILVWLSDQISFPCRGNWMIYLLFRLRGSNIGILKIPCRKPEHRCDRREIKQNQTKSKNSFHSDWRRYFFWCKLRWNLWNSVIIFALRKCMKGCIKSSYASRDRAWKIN